MHIAKEIPQARRLALFTFSCVFLYVALDVALIFLRPEYSLIYNAESDYGRGPWFWVMDLNFLLRCALSLSLALALRRTVRPDPRLRSGLLLIVVWAGTSGLLAFFTDDVEGRPIHGSGGVHLVLAFIAFVCVAIGTIRVSMSIRDDPAWGFLGTILFVLASLGMVGLVVLGTVFQGSHPPDGLFERIFLGIELLWIAVVAGFIATRNYAWWNHASA